MDDTLYCIASSASISVLQSFTTAVGLPPAAVEAAAGAVPDVAIGVPYWPPMFAFALVVPYAGEVPGVETVDGNAVTGSLVGGLFPPPHAASANVQATASTGIFMFIIRPLLL
ncbi:MAG TPA: hypothetical protein VFG67_08460 [Oleiagrimonas sp.]|nr:hypothetical protein [Oleiagrimonas sp.]